MNKCTMVLLLYPDSVDVPPPILKSCQALTKGINTGTVLLWVYLQSFSEKDVLLPRFLIPQDKEENHGSGFQHLIHQLSSSFTHWLGLHYYYYNCTSFWNIEDHVMPVHSPHPHHRLPDYRVVSFIPNSLVLVWILNFFFLPILLWWRMGSKRIHSGNKETTHYVSSQRFKKWKGFFLFTYASLSWFPSIC